MKDHRRDQGGLLVRVGSQFLQALCIITVIIMLLYHCFILGTYFDILQNIEDFLENPTS
jgi:hypothetical protein